MKFKTTAVALVLTGIATTAMLTLEQSADAASPGATDPTSPSQAIANYLRTVGGVPVPGTPAPGTPVPGTPVPGGAHANDGTGMSLYHYCQYNHTSCQAFLLGVWDGWMLREDTTSALHQVNPAAYSEPKSTLCGGTAEQPVTAEQMRLVFLRYAHNHPERLNYRAEDEAIAAFIDAFPCR